MDFALLFLFLTILSLARAGPPEQHDYVYHPDVDMSYRFFAVPREWNVARSHCLASGARLAMAKNQQELNVLLQIYNTYPPSAGASGDYLALGFHDHYAEGSFVNERDGRSIPNLNWASGEPNELTVKAKQDCGCMSRLGQLHDFPCTWSLSYMCEKPGNLTMEHNAVKATGIDFKDYNVLYMLWPKNFRKKNELLEYL